MRTSLTNWAEVRRVSQTAQATLMSPPFPSVLFRLLPLFSSQAEKAWCSRRVLPLVPSWRPGCRRVPALEAEVRTSAAPEGRLPQL